MACQACRARKIKCNRARPVCNNCRQRSSHCTYAGERRTRPWAGVSINTRHLQLSVIRNPQIHTSNVTDTQRVHETVTQEPIEPTPSLAPGPSATELASPGETWQQLQQASTTTIRNISPSHCPPMDSDPDPIPGVFSQMTYDTGAVPQTPTGSDLSQDDNLLDRILEGHNMECLNDTNPALWMRGSDGDEYTGPSSGISTISDLGLDWVRRNVADSDVLCETIQDIRHGVFNHLRHPKCMPQGLPLTPSIPCNLKEIPQSQLLRYVDAYFSDVQVLFPILDRDRFLTQLSTLGANQEGQRYSWIALLNAVLASGCRAALSDETAEAFKASGREAWGYLQNALSFESRIIHDATDLLAVQAMAVMTVFAQGLSSPQRLEYTLSSIASRLAQSLALNRHAPPEWNLSEDEKRERNRVFWVIYCLDKMIALRCGRPSVVCDDEISCWFPRGVKIIQRGEEPADTAAEPPSFDFFLCFTRLARICGNVSRRLYSASALYTPSPQLLRTLNRLLQDLESWVRSIPNHVRPGTPFTRILDTSGLSRAQIIVLHLSYFYVLCAIYRRLTPIFTQDSKSLEHLVDQKSHVSHIEAARVIVLLTKHLDIESYTPAWLVFYYPFTALTTIFVHIVSNPPNESTQSDIALMETVVGFFGRLEYVTAGETAFTKTTEFVRQARRATDRHGNGACTGQITTSPTNSNISNKPVTSMGQSLQDHMGTDDDQLDIPEGFTDLAHVQGVISSRMIGTSYALGIPSPQTEVNGGGQHSESEGVNLGMGVTDQDQSLYADLLCHSAPSPSDTYHSHWLGDWVPVD